MMRNRTLGWGRGRVAASLLPGILLPSIVIFCVVLLTYGSSQLQLALQSIFEVYGFAVICSSPLFWAIMLCLTIVALILLMIKKDLYSYLITQIMIVVTFIIPPVFLMLGIIRYCGE